LRGKPRIGVKDGRPGSLQRGLQRGTSGS
jgi:hypothetical protein